MAGLGLLDHAFQVCDDSSILLPLLKNLLEDIFQVCNERLILFALLSKLLERRWKGFQSVKVVFESLNLIARLLFGFTYNLVSS